MDIARKPRGFRWESRYDTGLPDIDSQHRVLLSLINLLIAALDTPDETAVVRRCLAELVAYASRHFECEEALMEAHGLGEHEAEHVLIHRRFAGFVLQRADLVGREPGAALDIASFLVGWLAHHILNTDQKMAALIRATRLANDMPREAVPA
jgi:hemerythrin-like metal-binding protein